MCIGAASVFLTLCLPASIAVLFVLSLPLPSIPFTHTQLMCLGRSCPTGADSVLVGMWHDLPETPRQEEQLRRAKVAAEAASDAKSIVLRNMRHEICTPMHANNPVLLVPLTRSLPFPSPFHLLPVCRFGLPFTSPSSPLTLPFLCLLLPISPPLSLPFSSLSPPISLRFPSSSVLLASPSPPFSIPFPSLSPPDPLPIPSRFPPIPIPVPSPSPPRSLPFPSPSSLITCTSRQGFQVRLTCALPEVSAGWGEVGGEMGVGGVGGGGEGRGGGGMDLQEANRAALYQPSEVGEGREMVVAWLGVSASEAGSYAPYVRWQFVSGPPASIGTIMQIYPAVCSSAHCVLTLTVGLWARGMVRHGRAAKTGMSAEEKTSRGAKKQRSPSIVLANTSHKIRMVSYALSLMTDLAIIDSQSLPLEGVNTLFPLPSGGREYSLPPSLWRA
ncbi:unnamed protein product [Closterium sp. NIES-64]|nr:unnamed protein product [Closterium sp. NIES-64]